MNGPTERGWDIDGLELSREFMEEACRMNFQEMAKGYQWPGMLLHGTNDADIPVESSYILKHIYGDCCELNIVEGANHRFLSLKWKQEVYDKTLAFIRKHLN